MGKENQDVAVREKLSEFYKDEYEIVTDEDLEIIAKAIAEAIEQ